MNAYDAYTTTVTPRGTRILIVGLLRISDYPSPATHIPLFDELTPDLVAASSLPLYALAAIHDRHAAGRMWCLVPADHHSDTTRPLCACTLSPTPARTWPISPKPSTPQRTCPESRYRHGYPSTPDTADIPQRTPITEPASFRQETQP